MNGHEAAVSAFREFASGKCVGDLLAEEDQLVDEVVEAYQNAERPEPTTSTGHTVSSAVEDKKQAARVSFEKRLKNVKALVARTPVNDSKNWDKFHALMLSSFYCAPLHDTMISHTDTFTHREVLIFDVNPGTDISGFVEELVVENFEFELKYVGDCAGTFKVYV